MPFLAPLFLALAQAGSPASSAPPASSPPAAAKLAPGGSVVVLDTTLGRIRIGLNREKAPITVDNFLKYVRARHYDGTIFHRVIPGFMIQGGGHDSDMKERPTGAPIRNEARNGLRNLRGTVAMARMNDPDSATAQFFINVARPAPLQRTQARGHAEAMSFGYVAFGRAVLAGSLAAAAGAIVGAPAAKASFPLEGDSLARGRKLMMRRIEDAAFRNDADGQTFGVIPRLNDDADFRWIAPPEERARLSPVPPSPQALQKGRALYQRHCMRCHGDKGKGDGPAARFGVEEPEDLTDPTLQNRLTDGEIFWKISTGLRSGSEVVMPAFKKEMPSDEDRWKVVMFVRSFAPPQE